ncbi:hydrolase 2, exosortase A system-associated [Hydrogenophaga sp.]|uniref:hydrolase 2, exosortase A system-associated n=1 Tax=Hydrogenophaga sp. TaxID=1904254 RepID=UPI003F6B9F0A
MTPPERPALPQAFFMPDGAGGQRFCLFHPPQGAACRGRVLYLHPFAEELNTTRRVVAQQARTMAQAGYAVLQVDLLGCGDSSGDFANATWQAWQADALRAHNWLQHHASGPLWMWGLRAGALLAVHLVTQLNTPNQGPAAGPAHLLLWQPVHSGQLMLQQFLRLHAAAQWLGNSSAHAPSPAKALAQGQPVDMAGYTLTPALAQGMGRASLQPPPGAQPGQMVWLDVSPLAAPTTSPASENALHAWRSAGWQVQAHTVAGPAFWQTVGTYDAPALIQATLAALRMPQPTP